MLDSIAAFFQAIIEWLCQAFGAVLRFLFDLFDTLLEMQIDAIKTLWSWLGWAGNEVFNMLLEAFNTLVIVPLESHEFTFNVLTGAIDVLVWINYFFPLAECARFAKWAVVTLPIIYIVSFAMRLTIKAVRG